MTANQQLLWKALDAYADRVAVGGLVSDTARANDRRAARVSFAVPDEVVKSLTGSKRRPGKALIVFVPGEVLEEMESPIVRPSVVGSR